ncbi:MAG: Asp-tRNA(Asn)/Glu-tRNA(Gln) amidotransferase A subunit family amidase [Salinirussus sp.]|jgi:Asp-tRNA(Asn)/Glu-tRNA(Gln) amidotransferase A subunit family amidase
MLDVMAGPDDRDPFTRPAREGSYRTALREPVADLRVAYSPDLGVCPLVGDVREAVDGLVDDLRGRVATVDRVDPALSGWEAAHKPLATLLRARYRGIYDTLREEQEVDILDRRGRLRATRAVGRGLPGRPWSPTGYSNCAACVAR